MLVSNPMTSGTPCLAASAARYFLLMSPKGCSTKLTLTPGWDCSNNGIMVSIETLSKYQTVSSVLDAPLSSAAAGSVVAPSVPVVSAATGRSIAGALLGLHAVINSVAPISADRDENIDANLRLA